MKSELVTFGLTLASGLPVIRSERAGH